MPGDYKLQIYITRHGESWGNLPPALDTGLKPETEAEKHDPELTPLGVAQARLLGQRLSLNRFDAIFSSPLIRAVLTACETSMLQPGSPVPVDLLDDLREAGTPWDYSGYTLAEIKKRCPCVSSLEQIRDRTCWAAAEAYDEKQRHEAYLRRAGGCIDFFRSRYQNGEKILVVAHGTFNTYLIRSALSLSNMNDFNFCQENTGLTKVKYFLDGKARLSYSNDTSHLYAGNSALTFTL